MQARVDREPGFRPAAPAHHSLKVQSKLSPRLPQVELPPLEMSKAEELAALMHVSLVGSRRILDSMLTCMQFVTGTAANALPITHDPTKQIEAEAFLPFNPASPDAMTELEELVREQWEQYPVMVLGKMRDPKMREIRRVLKTYNIKPAPAFVDFDQRCELDRKKADKSADQCISRFYSTGRCTRQTARQTERTLRADAGRESQGIRRY